MCADIREANSHVHTGRNKARTLGVLQTLETLETPDTSDTRH